jgi:hypothetical protein
MSASLLTPDPLRSPTLSAEISKEGEKDFPDLRPVPKCKIHVTPFF